MKVIAVVHAKGESNRLPNKNTRLLGGMPLVEHAIRNAKNSKATDVVVDSDESTILKIGLRLGTKILKRPPYLARNEITGDDLAYWQAQNFPDYDIIVQVVPTSPFTKPETINACIDNVISGYNSCFTANIERLYTWKNRNKPNYLDGNRILNSKDLEGVLVEYTGVYAFDTRFAFTKRKRIDIHSYNTVPISSVEKIDINYEEDFEFAEVIWKGLNSSSP